jgi:hypothetical protein
MARFPSFLEYTGGPAHRTPTIRRVEGNMKKIANAVRRALSIRPRGENYWWAYHQI